MGSQKPVAFFFCHFYDGNQSKPQEKIKPVAFSFTDPKSPP